MAPKKQAEGEGLTAEQQEAARVSERIKRRALDAGVIAGRQVFTSQRLPLPKALIKSDGKDILKKSSYRKNRYMLVFDCLLAPAAAGRMGVLSQMDTKNPVLYLDFPAGRLKLFGTLAFPHNKYMVLRLGGGSSVLCEDVFETLIIFSEAWWVGTKEQNPDEKQLPMPPELQTQQQHDAQKYAFTSGEAEARAGGKGSKAAAEEVDEAEEEEGGGGSQRPRRAAAKRRKVLDDGLPSESGDEDEDEGELPQRAARKRPQAAKSEEEEPVMVISSDEADDGQAVPGSSKQDDPKKATAGSQEGRAARGTPSRHAGAAARKRLADWEEDDSGGNSDQGDDGSEYEESAQD